MRTYVGANSLWTELLSPMSRQKIDAKHSHKSTGDQESLKPENKLAEMFNNRDPDQYMNPFQPENLTYIQPEVFVSMKELIPRDDTVDRDIIVALHDMT